MGLYPRHGDGMVDDDDMSGMMTGGDDSDSSSGTLSAAGVDFSNSSQAADFLENLLDDTELKVIGNAYARYFWYGVIVVVAIAAIFSFARRLTLHVRLREAARKQQTPAKPKNVLLRWFATVTAMGREVAYMQFSPTWVSNFFKVPPVGTLILILGYLAFVLILEFANNNVAGAQHWQALGVRAGWLAVAQVPLLVLLVGKNNLIGFVTGVSYERLNILHRWSARITLVLAIFHFAFQSTAWAKFGLMSLEWTTDDCPATGIAAFALLLWMNLTTVAPLRKLSYEFFVAQHILTFFGFIIAVMYHLPSTALTSRVYIYIPIGLYLVDRIIRTLRLAWHNARTSKATLTQSDGGVTKIRVSNKIFRSWSPGSHVLISLPRFGLMQSHPATILSTPRSHEGDLVFLLKSHKGFTKRIMDGANSSTTALIEKDGDAEAQIRTHLALIDGPYGASQADMAAFDSICLIAGSTGITFTLSVLQDIADRATHNGRSLPLRRIHFVWCVRDSNWTSWVRDEISAACDMLRTANINTRVSIYVTCAEKFTDRDDAPRECGCACDESLGPCCCVVVDEDEDEHEDEDTITPVSEHVSSQEKGKAVWSTTKALKVDTVSPNGRRLPGVMPCAFFFSGRPQIRQLLDDVLEGAQGESGVAVCGPLGMTTEVRNTIASLSDERAIHKGTGAQGCYLHVETPN